MNESLKHMKIRFSCEEAGPGRAMVLDINCAGHPDHPFKRKLTLLQRIQLWWRGVSHG
jgi:hypothetical protein